jgi:hypothetical protein
MISSIGFLSATIMRSAPYFLAKGYGRKPFNFCVQFVAKCFQNSSQAGTKKVLFKIIIGTVNTPILNIEYRTRNFEYRSVVSIVKPKRLRRVLLCLFI